MSDQSADVELVQSLVRPFADRDVALPVGMECDRFTLCFTHHGPVDRLLTERRPGAGARSTIPQQDIAIRAHSQLRAVRREVGACHEFGTRARQVKRGNLIPLCWSAAAARAT